LHLYVAGNKKNGHIKENQKLNFSHNRIYQPDLFINLVSLCETPTQSNTKK